MADSGRIRDRRYRAAARDGLESSAAKATRSRFFSGCFTANRGQGAVAATWRETLPNKNPWMSLKPRDPMRMRSAFSRRAVLAMVWAIGPCVRIVWSFVLGPVAAWPRASRAARAASRNRMVPAFSIAARARFAATGFLFTAACSAGWSTMCRSVTCSGSRLARASSAWTPHCECSDPSTAHRIRITGPLSYRP